MQSNIKKELLELKATIIDDMCSYAIDCKNDGGDAGYTEEEVKRCKDILDKFLASTASSTARGNKEIILASVKETVIALNVLNTECNGNIIETDQREGICELLIAVAKDAGLDSGDEDITEEWREW